MHRRHVELLGMVVALTVCSQGCAGPISDLPNHDDEAPVFTPGDRDDDPSGPPALEDPDSDVQNPGEDGFMDAGAPAPSPETDGGSQDGGEDDGGAPDDELADDQGADEGSAGDDS